MFALSFLLFASSFRWVNFYFEIARYCSFWKIRTLLFLNVLSQLLENFMLFIFQFWFHEIILNPNYRTNVLIFTFTKLKLIFCRKFSRDLIKLLIIYHYVRINNYYFSMFHLVQSTRSFHIFPGELKKIEVYSTVSKMNAKC